MQKLLEWNGTDAWAEKAGTPGSENAIFSLKVFNNKLYGGSSPTGKLYEWNGTDAWIQKAAQLNGQLTTYGLVELNGDLYGVMAYNGKLFKWNGTDAWTEVADELNDGFPQDGIVYDNKIYMGGGSAGNLQEWNGTDAWVQRAPELNSQDIYSIIGPPAADNGAGTKLRRHVFCSPLLGCPLLWASGKK